MGLIVISGKLGSGKTTVLSHLLTQCNPADTTVVVNDLADIHIDSMVVTFS
jgi:G3E family GTPase